MKTKTAIPDSEIPVQPIFQGSPSASVPTEKVPAKKSSQKGCLIGCGLTALILIILFTIVAVVFGKFLTDVFRDFQNQDNNNQNQTTESAQVNTVVGNSIKDTPPYTTIDEKNIASATFGSNGGVLSTELSGNVTAYFIVPENAIIQSATISLIPYTAMPTSKKQGNLSDEYGYGVQVEISSFEMGVGGYLVFDTKGGETIEEATSSATKFNRCDPRFNWFDPYLCGKKNLLTADKVVTKTATVVTPLFTENYDDLVFLQNTIPTGIDGLIAMRVERGDVYIPQKLDKSLATTLIHKTLKDESSRSQQMEAAALALEWEVKDLTMIQLELIDELDAEYFPEYTKSLYILQQYQKMITDKDFAVLETIENDDFEDIVRTYSDSYDYIRESFLEYAVSETADYRNVEAIEATAAISDAQGLGIEGSDDAFGQVQSNLNENRESEYGQPGRTAGVAEGSSYTGGQKNNPDVEAAREQAKDIINDTLGNPNATLPELLNAWYLAKVFDLEAANEELHERVQDSVTEMMEDVLNDPNATLSDVLKAWELYRILGPDDDDDVMRDRVFDKLEEIIRKMMRDGLTKKEYLEIAELCRLLGFDDLYNEAIAKANAAPEFQDCDLIKKNLSNYGINDCGGDE